MSLGGCNNLVQNCSHLLRQPVLACTAHHFVAHAAPDYLITACAMLVYWHDQVQTHGLHMWHDTHTSLAACCDKLSGL